MENMKFWLTLACTSLAAAMLLSVCPVRGEGDLYRDVLRLRVVAASDSEEDQADKLAVRDAVLALVGDRIRASENREEAEAAVERMEEEILARAEECLRERGSEDPVRVKLGWEESPRREYGSAVLPAGSYRTLNVTIGGGGGHNWWCVLFPGVCLRYAEAEDESVAVGLTPEEYRLITGAGKGRIRVKFWILEKLSEIAGIREKQEDTDTIRRNKTQKR